MFWNNYVNLCISKGKKPNPVAKELKISSGTVTSWKNGSIPQAATLQKIADYFEVSVDYLLGKEEQKEKPTTESDELFKEAKAIMESLSPEARKQALEYLQFLQEKSNKQ